MKRNLLKSIFVALLFATAASNASASGNVTEGKKKAESCKACHGEGGAKPIQADYPVLAGQHADYLAAALTQYKVGKRKNEIMKGFAAPLSAKDIQDIAAYFAAQPSALKYRY